MKKLCLIVVLSCLLACLAYGETGVPDAPKTAGEQSRDDEKTAFEENRRKAEAGDLEAQYNLGVHYMRGQGVSMNVTEAYRLVRDAAEKGNASAQNWMGEFYADSDAAEDMAQAVQWWGKAAVQGNPFAQSNMGQCYEYGTGVQQNYKTAVSWYLLAADKNVDDAKFALSVCYLDGKGVKKDVKEALYWMLLCFPGSWDAGHDSLEVLVHKLKPAEVKKVKARALKWMEMHQAKV